MTSPKISFIEQRDTRRLIPSKYGDPVLERLADSAEERDDLYELERVTNRRTMAETGLLPGITPLELVYKVPFDNIINAAFCYSKPQGSRFNGPERGAWYAAFEREAAVSEVIYHKAQALWEIGWYHDKVEYHEFWADFVGDFHDIRGDENFEACLDPKSYIASQNLAESLLCSGSFGIVYPSVRHPGGTNVVCFRPAMVDNVRRKGTCTLEWTGKKRPTITWDE